MGETYAGHVSQAHHTKKWVVLYGTEGDVFPVGFGVCYNRDYGTATDNVGNRDHHVEVPSQTNHEWFAGVLLEAVTIPAQGYVPNVMIAIPGSVCEIAIGQQDAVIGVTRFGCSFGAGDAGRFGLPGLPGGRGSALALQSASMLSVAMDGSAAYTTANFTLTDTGEYGDVSAGDRFVFVGFDGATVGIQTVASATANTLVFAADVGDAANRALVSGYAIGPTETRILAYLCTGEESGMQEVVQLVDNVAFVLAAGGYSYLAPGTLGTGDAIETLADGTYEGQRKFIRCLGSNTTNDADVTISHHETSDPEHLFFKLADQFTSLIWHSPDWFVEHSNAPTTT